MLKALKSTCRKPSSKSTPSLTSFLRYCYDIANLQFVANFHNYLHAKNQIKDIKKK